jgi:hypothetical protein
LTIYITPEALAERIMGIERLIREKDEAALRAAKIEAAALEDRIRQDVSEKYAVKTDLDKIKDKMEKFPSRVELIAAITFVSSLISIAFGVACRLFGKG